MEDVAKPIWWTTAPLSSSMHPNPSSSWNVRSHNFRKIIKCEILWTILGPKRVIEFMVRIRTHYISNFEIPNTITEFLCTGSFEKLMMLASWWVIPIERKNPASRNRLNIEEQGEKHEGAKYRTGSNDILAFWSRQRFYLWHKRIVSLAMSFLLFFFWFNAFFFGQRYKFRSIEVWANFRQNLLQQLFKPKRNLLPRPKETK